MKKLLFIFFLLGVFSPCIPEAEASPSLLQIVVFDWNESLGQLEIESLGSGTALERDIILTNKHVVTRKDGSIVDFLLLCPAQSKATHSVECNIPAVVVAVHPQFDAALVRPIFSGVFLPRVRTAQNNSSTRDSIRIYGFPRPAEGLQNFGGTKTFENIKKWQEEGGTLETGGDALTITRGNINMIAQRKDTKEIYYLTDVKVNFGNSGGAAFDETGVFIGIPTLKDTESHALVLAYPQLQEWVLLHRSDKPEIPEDILKFYYKQIAKKKEDQTVSENEASQIQGVQWKMLRRRPRIKMSGKKESSSLVIRSLSHNYFGLQK